MAKKTIAVAGATGHVGKVVAARLKAAGHDVRRLSRSSGVSFDDLTALTDAFSGAEGAFLMIPPDDKAVDMRKRMSELGAKLATAAKAAGVPRVVFLSSLNAHLTENTGPILGLRDMEDRLDALEFAELVHLRPAYFMENHLRGVEFIARNGCYGTMLRPDLAIPMISTWDIGAKAADLLVEEPFTQPRVRELLGPRSYTMTEVARILGAAIGKPNLKYVQHSYDEGRHALHDIGLSSSAADAMIELNRHLNETMIMGTEPRSAVNTTPTTLESFARLVFQPAFEAAAGVMR